jgi:hypothetical protein
MAPGCRIFIKAQKIIAHRKVKRMINYLEEVIFLKLGNIPGLRLTRYGRDAHEGPGEDGFQLRRNSSQMRKQSTGRIVHGHHNDGLH